MLEQNNVRLVGVGLEEFGVKEFMDAKYLEGGKILINLIWACFTTINVLKTLLYSIFIFFISEVYIDEGKKSYAALNFKRITFLQLFPAILSAAARAARSRAKTLGLGGNNYGDGWQNGGCLVVEKGGGEKPLLFYIQETAPAIVSNRSILKV